MARRETGLKSEKKTQARVGSGKRTPWVEVCQPDEEKNWERKLFSLLTPALMGDPSTEAASSPRVQETPNKPVRTNTKIFFCIICLSK